MFTETLPNLYLWGIDKRVYLWYSLIMLGMGLGKQLEIDTMWKTKCFKSREIGQQWLSSHAVQWEEIFVNNTAFAITYRPLRVIG